MEKRKNGIIFFLMEKNTAIVNRNRVMYAANRMQLQIRHFARGVFPRARGEITALPFNRFFLPIANPEGPSCYIRDGEKEYELRPGFAYFIPIYHPAGVRLSEDLRFLSIQFTIEVVEGVDLFSRAHAVREIENPGWLAQAEKAFDTPSLYVAASRLRCVTQEFITFLLGDGGGPELEFVTRFAEFQPGLDYIQNHCTAATTVEELAALRKTRRETFTRKFTAATGITPKALLTQAVLNRAGNLLLRGNYRVREVAFELGFSNEFYFSRFFKKHTGMPPHRFKELYGHPEI